MEGIFSHVLLSEDNCLIFTKPSLMRHEAKWRENVDVICHFSKCEGLACLPEKLAFDIPAFYLKLYRPLTPVEYTKLCQAQGKAFIVIHSACFCLA